MEVSNSTMMLVLSRS